MYNQLYILILFVLTGIVIGVLFDCFRIIRRTFKTPDFITYIEDILFWIMVGIILLFSIFTFNSGEIRSFVFLGIVIGISIYFLTISKFFIKMSVIILSFIKQLLYFPFKLIYKYIFIPFSTILTKLLKKIKLKRANKPSKNIINDNLSNN